MTARPVDVERVKACVEGLCAVGWNWQQEDACLEIISVVEALLAERDRLMTENIRLDADLEREVANRDRAEEWADRLAYAIARESIIGEHSSGNNPWENALTALEVLR